MPTVVFPNGESTTHDPSRCAQALARHLKRPAAGHSSSIKPLPSKNCDHIARSTWMAAPLPLYLYQDAPTLGQGGKRACPSFYATLVAVR